MFRLYSITILIHAVFWSLSIGLFAFIFRISDTLDKIDIVFSCLFHLSILIGVYVNFHIIKPWLLNRKRHIAYAIAFLLLVALVTILNKWTFEGLSDLLFSKYYFVSVFDYPETVVLVLFYISFTLLISLSSSWFRLQETQKRLAQEEKEHIDSQLKMLRSQVNPHFLFISLNLIYSLNLKKSDRTGQAIIELSDVLRYVIYESNGAFVKITAEINLLENYLNLQRHRVEKSTSIRFVHKVDKDVRISPMLLLPLVENSFKHGVKGDIRNTFVDMSLQANSELINFEITNNIGQLDSKTPKHDGGIGLENINQRLKLLYPDRHELHIEERNKEFNVVMTLYHGD